VRPSADMSRAIGNVTLACSAVLLALFLANLRSQFLYHGPDYSFLGWISVYAAVTGVGLRRSFKWAAILFAFPCYILGLFLAVGSVFKVPLPWVLLDVAMGLLFCIVATKVLKEWLRLR